MATHIGRQFLAKTTNIDFFNIGIPNLVKSPALAGKPPVWVRPEEHKAVGAALEALRRRAGVTQVALAKQLQKPQSFVSSYERGQRRIDLLEFLVIVEALGGKPRVVFTDVLRQRAQLAVQLPTRGSRHR